MNSLISPGCARMRGGYLRDREFFLFEWLVCYRIVQFFILCFISRYICSGKNELFSLGNIDKLYCILNFPSLDEISLVL